MARGGRRRLVIDMARQRAIITDSSQSMRYFLEFDRMFAVHTVHKWKLHINGNRDHDELKSRETYTHLPHSLQCRVMCCLRATLARNAEISLAASLHAPVSTKISVTAILHWPY